MKQRSMWTCPTCGKHTFTSKAEARREANIVDRSCRPYRCPGDRSLWHYGHLPQAVLKGDHDRRWVWQTRGKSA